MLGHGSERRREAAHARLQIQEPGDRAHEHEWPERHVPITAASAADAVQVRADVKINGLTANGDTNLHEGIMWGWRSLSPNAPLSDGKPYDTSANPTNQKVLVLMT